MYKQFFSKIELIENQIVISQLYIHICFQHIPNKIHNVNVGNQFIFTILFQQFLLQFAIWILNIASKKQQKKIGKYKILEIIGQGSEGKVYKVECEKQLFALKQIKPMFKVNLEVYTNIGENENLVQFIEVFSHQENSYEVYEYCEGGNLTEHMQKQKIRQKFYNKIYLTILQWLQGVPDNIVFKMNQAKIADFGFARFVPNPEIKWELSVKCSPFYASPQLFEAYFSSKCDVWSFGLILYKMVYGFSPHQSNTQISDVKRFHQDIKYNRVPFPENDMPSVVTLIKQMLRYSEDDRISWVQIFQHPLVGQSNDNEMLVYSPRILEEFNMRIYFEDKIYQLQIFNSLISNQESDIEQILIILNLWLSYILQLKGEINGQIVIKNLQQKQQMFINGSQAKRVRSVVKEYQMMVEDQIKFINYLDQKRHSTFSKNNQNFQKMNCLEQKEQIESLNCSQETKQQLKQIFKI
ncbi:unnamed protein product (macronuclear) [Paramecium tetraurelia]|uniref:Protein kinase domain-containing protein n=1 Tax=Paramecium tetraurelia TaxID=5888 RepID=A0CC71_PARTE|nr:uncharacterized protein GSPATT00037172001 [Paramecium tetraurelia]CAK68388.1 unnamed protein product [Paramecium tetraurelia]|eukprot:XP_001435785.1 hypothetical protein (macronuclear) [Paramecium tetraurelia strain d4-2]